MFRDKDKHLKRLEKELLAEETEKDAPVWEQEDWVPEDTDEAFEAPLPRQPGMSRLMKLSVTALCLLGGILLVLLYWLVRFL